MLLKELFHTYKNNKEIVITTFKKDYLIIYLKYSLIVNLIKFINLEK